MERLVSGADFARMARIDTSTVRHWARLGHIRRKGTGKHGAAMYEFTDLVAMAVRLGHLPSKDDDQRGEDDDQRDSVT